VVCHCRELHNKKPEEQRSEFEAMLATAAVNSPSVLVWDDLDQLVPALDPDPSNEVNPS